MEQIYGEVLVFQENNNITQRVINQLGKNISFLHCRIIYKHCTRFSVEKKNIAYISCRLANHRARKILTN